MTVLVFGANGQLGRALQNVMPEAIFYDHTQVDITDAVRVAGIVAAHKPDVVINAAAYTNVDGAETHRDDAKRVNADGSLNIAIACSKNRATYIYISTDYVFDGKAKTGYKPDDAVNPLNVYGTTKQAGEQYALGVDSHYVVRTSWVYGDGNNFVRTMLRLGKELNEVSVVNDQWGLPTYAIDLAQFCKYLVQTKPRCGIYHFCNRGEPINWATLAEAVFEIAGLDCKVAPVTTQQYYAGKDTSAIATRPHYTALDCSYVDRELHYNRRMWRDALKEYVNI